MLWRYKLSVLHLLKRTYILKPLSVRNFSSSPIVCISVNDKTHHFFSQENLKAAFTPQIVHSTLVNCRSDLIALSFFIWCAKQHNYFHDNQAFDYMVSVVGRLTNRYKTLKGIVKELESVGLLTKAQTFLLLLRIYWRGRMYSMVFETFEEMGNFGFKPNTFAHNVVIDVLFKIGHVDAGIKVLKQIEIPNFLSFSIILSNLCKLNDLVNVKDVLRIMLKEGYYPNVETFEMVLNCFCKVGRLVEAYQVLGVMITLGISLSVNAWSILIYGFCRLHQPDIASLLLEKMVKSGCSPNIVTYTTLFKGFMESEMIPCAFDMLNTMESKGYAPDLLLCNVLIDSLSKIGRYDDALDLFLGMSKWKLVPDSYTFSSLLSTICFSRRFNLLPKLVRGLVVEADLVVCNSLLNYLCKAGFPNLALELYNDMIDKGFMPDNYSFVGLLRGLCGVRRVDEAVKVYLGMVMNYTGLDAHVHTSIIDGLMKNGKYNRAIKLFRRAISEKYPLDAVSYTVAICGLLKSGRAAEAFALYNHMKEVGLSPNVCTYNIMLYGFCVKRDIKVIEMLLKEIIEAGIQLDCNTFFRLTKVLFKSHLSSSFFNRLIKLWNLLLMPNEVMHLLLFDGLTNDINLGDTNHSLMKGYLEDNLFVDSSSSDDLPNVAASVG
ncbi:hypothetical protein P3X46_018324 [Hevea brasiliensis]|uniref:Pentacotripeptide-repeat region of PRORP domain-containing protein n=1 Tax=Hevea brasiliensis TaxID=3981 RepID=A0ABQ9LU70_HEVBR|nr:putative pentatricopeptide repeat-containing protein At1g16830 [Hevea brasiliensis]XP_021676804.2 putative pentatricopeptide repeat-containing protein At1g16830 [Hevea brasiliensis]XP_021676805.2 putative pentatricopeptide repeat-containing protein At1g16830 [Hevea brasiliensis]XP_021676806.2 putative pentatricopeptide repeat-containing protein At1g16830 [Hevea brasiliensis]XP_021676807.2 putative pentatricopeptide repeat-containing protein At1g16830 [Hevea brasiliensis]XP_021676808.2 putat